MTGATRELEEDELEAFEAAPKEDEAVVVERRKRSRSATSMADLPKAKVAAAAGRWHCCC